MTERHRSFEELFDTEFDACVTVARRITGNAEVAEELAAEAFARAWVRWRRIAGGSSPGGWVIRVTSNLAIDHARRRRRAEKLPIEVSGSVPVDDVVATRVALNEALGKLSRRQRDVIVLRHLAGLSEADTAAALGVSTGSVKAHAHRGLGRLRSIMTDPTEVATDG